MKTENPIDRCDCQGLTNMSRGRQPFEKQIRLSSGSWISVVLALVFAISFVVAVSFAGAGIAQETASTETSASLSADKAYRIEKHGGVVYSSIDGVELDCDVYCPKDDEKFPAVLLVHGGAWRGGSKLHVFRHARQLSKSGYVVVAINYRHAPTYKFPAQIEDCKAAVAWMRKNAETYKIDVDRIGAWGYSAGGHLVSMLGVTNMDDGFNDALPDDLKNFDTHVSVVVAGGAPCYLEWIPEQSNAIAYWLGDSRADDPEVYRRASPMSYVRKDSPPFYFFHGSSDHIVPVRGSKNFYDKLKFVGVECEYVEYLGQGHIDTFVDMASLEKSMEFLDKHLKPMSPAGNDQ